MEEHVEQPGLADPSAEPPALVAGRYRPVRLLGRGGMGVVYEAEDTRLGRRVAVKMLTAVEGLTAQDAAWERFQREARALARIEHPGVVTLYDNGVHDGTPYLVMQVLDGTSLAELVLHSGPLPVPAACTVALGIAEALEAGHHKGVVQRGHHPRRPGRAAGLRTGPAGGRGGDHPHRRTDRHPAVHGAGGDAGRPARTGGGLVRTRGLCVPHADR
jgi:hypothetical protein